MIEEKNLGVLRKNLDEALCSFATSVKNAQCQIHHIERANEDLQKRVTSALAELCFCMSGWSLLQKTTAELYTIATTDKLTGLFNQRYLEEVMKPLIEKNPKSGVIFMDLDNFGLYNNKYGHQQVDVALTTIANVVSAYANSGAVARYGGEEFSIIFAEYYKEKGDVIRIAEKIRKYAANTRISPFSIDITAAEVVRKFGVSNRLISTIKRYLANTGSSLPISLPFEVRTYLENLEHVTLSIGVAMRKNKESADSLIKRADDAMYCAKQAGKNQVFTAV